MRYIFFLFVFFLTSILQGQQVIRISDDLKVFVAPDGGWTQIKTPLDSLKQLHEFSQDSSTLSPIALDKIEFLQSKIDSLLVTNEIELIASENKLNTSRFNKRMTNDKDEFRALKQEIKQIKKAVKLGKKIRKKHLALRSKIVKLYDKDEKSFGIAFERIHKKVFPKNVRLPSKKNERKNKNKSTHTSNPTDDNCTWLFNDYDDDAKGLRIQTPFYPSLVYTHPNMQSYYKDDQFMTGSISLSKVRKQYFLVLELTLKSLDARKSYGNIAQKEEVRIRTVDGDFIYATVLNTTEGIVEEYTGHVKYEIRTKIRKSDLKKLSQAYLDIIGIMWSSGYEEYPIYNIDVLHKPALCLLKQ